MQPLFSRTGEQALARTVGLQPLLAFDFDGTLAPIVSRPDDARVSAAVSLRLARLAALLPVAIITGRSVSDVQPRLGFEPRFIVGNHGAEDPDAPAPPSGAALDGLRQRLAAQPDALAAAGLEVEDKQHSVALHYRLARDRQLATDTLDRLLADLGPEVRVFGGKCVANVMPAGAPDKADAVARLVRRTGARAVIFAGDDLNDEPVFARPEPEWLTIRVGRDDPHSQARFAVDSPADMALVLERLLELLGQR